MKKMMLSMLILGLTASPVLAHCGVCGTGGDKKGSAKGSMMDKKGSMKDKGSMMDKMFEGLDLTDDQKAKIKKLKKAKYKAMKAAKEEFHKGFKDVLTPEQLKMFEAMHKDHHHEHKGSH